MPIKFDTSIKGVQETIERLERSKFVVRQGMKTATRESLEGFVKLVTTYPSESAGNKPPPPYWKRGAGRVVPRGTINPRSQNYGGPGGNLSSWDITIGGNQYGVIGRASTGVTYAPWVVGTATQAWFHRLHGWMTIRRAMKLLGLEGREISNVGMGVGIQSFWRIRDEFERVFAR